MASSVFTALYDLADMFWIGKLGTEAIAGVTIAMSLYWFGAIFNDLFGTPSSILLSRRYGEKDYDGMQKVFSQTILLKMSFAFLFAVIAFTLRYDFLRLLGSSGQAMEDAASFFSTRVWFMPFAFCSFTINTAFRSTGDVNRFATLQIIASVFNIVFDPFFMFVLDMGVAGAAFTTGLSELIVLITGLYWLSSGKGRVKLSLFKALKPDWAVIKTMFKLGSPTIVDGMSHHFFNLLLIRILNHYGVVIVAVWGVMGRVRTILYMVCMSLEMAVATLTGQNLGAGFRDRAKEAAFAGMRISMMLVAVYAAVAATFAPWIIGFFNNEPAIVEMGSLFIRILAIGDIFFAGYMGALGAISGAGQTKINMAISIIANWGILLPSILLITYVFKLGPTWLPWAFVLFNIATFTMSSFVIRGDWWLKKQI
jgi:putative MATE family efflux protein